MFARSARRGEGVKLDRAVFRYIEHELYSYDETVRQLEMLKDDIIQETPFRVTGTDSGISNLTESKGLRLVTNRAIVRLENTVRAIDDALALLSEAHRDLCELKYRQRKPWRQICEEMPTSERSYFRMRREIVEAVALEMGFIKQA